MQSKRHFSRDECAQLFARWRESGLKQRAFCEREGITYNTLQYLLYVKAKEKSTPAAAGGFVRVVEAPPPPSPSCSLTVKTGGDISIAFETAPEASYLAQIVRALGC